eukprot:12928868-Prorocentrum_lima.AAC.1
MSGATLQLTDACPAMLALEVIRHYEKKIRNLRAEQAFVQVRDQVRTILELAMPLPPSWLFLCTWTL